MFAVKQVFEDPDDFIPVPREVQHRRTEVIFLVMDQTQTEPVATDSNDVQDSDIAQFFGSIPDLPEREPQGEYEHREPLP